MAATKLTILSYNYAVGRASKIELLMLVLDFKVDYRLKTVKGIPEECMDCLNKNA